jgi:uncharacterized membrane protein YfcA
MDTYLIIGIAIIVILMAGFVQGVTSFGFALISMPLLTKFIPLQQVVPIVVVLSLLTNVAILINARRHVDLKKIWILILSSIAAAPVGTYLLLYVDANILKIGTGVLIVLFALALIRGFSIPVRNEKAAFIPVGLTSGLLNGSISMSGPPVALFLSNQGADKQTFRANITAYGIILNVITVCTYIFTGLLNTQVVTYISWMIPAMVIGVLLGIWAVKRINEVTFKRMALWLIIISGIWTILAGANLV